MSILIYILSASTSNSLSGGDNDMQSFFKDTCTNNVYNHEFSAGDKVFPIPVHDNSKLNLTKIIFILGHAHIKSEEINK